MRGLVICKSVKMNEWCGSCIYVGSSEGGRSSVGRMCANGGYKGLQDVMEV